MGQRQSQERVAEPEQVRLWRGRRGALWRREWHRPVWKGEPLTDFEGDKSLGTGWM